MLQLFLVSFYGMIREGFRSISGDWINDMDLESIYMKVVSL